MLLTADKATRFFVHKAHALYHTELAYNRRQLHGLPAVIPLNNGKTESDTVNSCLYKAWRYNFNKIVLILQPALLQ